MSVFFVVSTLTCVVYVGMAIFSLRLFAESWDVTGRQEASESDGIMKYYLAILLTIFGRVMSVPILYRIDSLLRRPAPEWVFAVLGIIVPFAIYYGTPSFS